MRDNFKNSILTNADKKMIFLTGDLGFGALEEIQKKLKNRFINAGISEQNMLSISAGLSKEGFDVWVYSIAPFVYARPFEQLRNDICFHNLPVKIVGNGAGYGYGVMGPTHHAIDDYGTLMNLPNIKIFTPVFNEDLPRVVKKLKLIKCPAYLRLGNTSSCKLKINKYSKYRKLTSGNGATIIGVGNIATDFIDFCNSYDIQKRPNLWAISEFDKNEKLPNFLKNTKIKSLIIIEEHLRVGSFGSLLTYNLIKEKIMPRNFYHMHAKKNIYNSYGNQKFLRKKSNLTTEFLKKLLNGFK